MPACDADQPRMPPWLLQRVSLLFQDENDNPPTFSKPAYFVSVVENIMAGTAWSGEARRREASRHGADGM